MSVREGRRTYQHEHSHRYHHCHSYFLRSAVTACRLHVGSTPGRCLTPSPGLACDGG